ncbi:AAA family ATPase [Burkholderia pseudomallei]|uniref:AAA family ATPase n=1 Tax=Burkholderia pseudomallei TaxID=28450 RepID=UPI00294A7FE7|nr:TOPRIM protein [Burkholderia pseudomallei]
MHTNIWSKLGANGNGPVLEAASEIPMFPIFWLWKFWLARGKLHLLAGPPSTGKTTLALAIAATLSIGGAWPDGSSAPRGRVLIWTGEDGVEDTLMPRLAASGANLENVYILRETSENGRSRAFDFRVDLPRLAAKLQELRDVVLVIIDSIAQIVSGNSNSNTQVRKDLEPVVVFSEQTGAAVLGLTHVTKGSKKKDPLERVNGSIAFGAVARIVMIVAPDESDRAGDGVPRSVIVRAKSNIGPTDGGLAYHVEAADIRTPRGTVESSKIVWDGPLDGSPKEILSEASDGASVLTKDSRLHEAGDFLSEILATGPVPSEVVQEEAARAGLSWATVRRAFGKIGVSSGRPMGEKRWYLSLNCGRSMSPGAMGTAHFSSRPEQSHQAVRSIFDIGGSSGQGIVPFRGDVPPGLASIAAPVSHNVAQVAQVAHVEQDQFGTDNAVWEYFVRNCVKEYRYLRQLRAYEDDDDERLVREEAIDDVLRGENASDQWKDEMKERLMRLNFVELAG